MKPIGPSTVYAFSLKGFFHLIRWPNLLIIVLAQYLSAIFLIGPPKRYFLYLSDPRLFLLVVATLLIAAGGYIINDYYDVKIDFINKPEKVVVGNLLKRRVAMATHVGLSVIGVGLGFLVSLQVAAINGLAAFLLWWYSNQLKRLPLVGNIVVSFLTGLAIALIGIHYEQYGLVFIYALFAFVISLIRELIKDIEDLKGDVSFGCKTLPVIWGIRKTKIVIYLVGAIFIALLVYLSWKTGNRLLITYFFLLSGFTGYLFYRLVQADTIKEFSFLSKICKVLMLAGILSMTFL